MDKRVPAVVPSLKELERMIKKEQTSGRLQSLRVPRDLSLGGTKPKKVYTPNLNVVRNKDKNKHVPVKTDRSQKKALGSSSRGQKRAADSSLSRDKHKHPKFLQSEGVFSQGMGELKRASYYSERSGTTHDHNHSATLPMPKISRGNWNINKNRDASIVNELMDEETDSESDTEYDPIILPLDRNKCTFLDCYKIKQEDLVDKIKKEEPSDQTETPMPPLLNGCNTMHDIKPKIKIEKIDEPITETYNAFTDSTLLCDEDNPAFSLLRLPDSFLGKTWKEDPKDKDVDYTLKHMPEGHVGKILIRKSGKMEMVVRNTKYVLNTDDTEGLAETAVLFPGEQSIALEPSLVTLGTITEKFALTPEWNNLFDRAKKKK